MLAWAFDAALTIRTQEHLKVAILKAYQPVIREILTKIKHFPKPENLKYRSEFFRKLFPDKLNASVYRFVFGCFNGNGLDTVEIYTVRTIGKLVVYLAIPVIAIG